MGQKPQATLMALLFFWLLSPTARAIQPDWKFRSLESAHFEVIYRVDQKPLAMRYIVAAEQAYELLIPIFKEAPERTIIVLNDDTDSTNGMASFLPYPMITVLPVLPSTFDTIDDYGDWPLELIVHEYTHILNMYPRHGIYWPLKYIFGGVIRPNAVLPKWYLEGLAVNLESHLTDHGRLRSDETQAAARALVLGERLEGETLPLINEQEIKSWPHGARPYLFGGWWWNNVHSEHGEAVIETWNQNFARRLPFFLNAPMREQTGKSAEELLTAASARVKADATRELATLKTTPRPAAKAIVDDKGEVSVFAVSPAGQKLIYWLNRPTVGSEAFVRVRTTTDESFSTVKTQSLFKSSGTRRVRWIDEDHVIFDQTDMRAPNVTFHDLFIYDLKHQSTTRLTRRYRALEPAVSGGGRTVAFIQEDGGRNRLMLLQLRGRKISTLVAGDFNERLSGPEFLNDHELLYVRRVRSGVEQLHVYNLITQKSEVWNSKLQSAQHPRKTSLGVLVSDSGTHVRNIYLAGADPVAPIALTNTLTHIETADYDPVRKEILFSELSADGRKLQSVPYASAGQHLASLAPVKIPAAVAPKITSVDTTDSSYQPIWYLYPRYWIPFVYTVENGSLLFQGTTSNSDPVGRNHYTLNASLDTVTNKPSYGLNFINSSLPTDIELGYNKSVSFLGASGLVIENQTAAFDLAQAWPYRYTRWNLGGLWTETKANIPLRRMGPQAGIQYSRLQNPLNQGSGVLAEFYVQDFVKTGNYLSYQRYYAHTATLSSLGGGHKLFTQARAALAPSLPMGYLVLGDRNVGGNYFVNLANSDFLLRGYPSGAFIGRKILNANVEYSFPAIEIARGWGTLPLFWRATELAIFADAMSVDGAGYKPSAGGYVGTHLSQYFMSTGAELRLSTTAGYHLPLNFTVGAYYGLNQRYGGGFSPFFGFGIGDLVGIENKTP